MSGCSGGGLAIVVHDDQLMIVIAIDALDVDTRIAERSRDGAELAGLVLIEPELEHVAHAEDLDPRGSQGGHRRVAVAHEEVDDAAEPAAAFEADARAAEH